MRRVQIVLACCIGVIAACHQSESKSPAVVKKPSAPVASGTTTQAAATADGSEPGSRIGDTMPAYSATLLDGSTFDVEKSRGKVVLLNIWATWCGPCRYEVPELSAMHAKYASQGFEVVGVSLDASSDVAAVRDFVKDKGIQYPVALDPDNKLANLFQASVIPTSILIDRKGRIAWRQIGAIEKGDAKVIEAIEKALKAAQ